MILLRSSFNRKRLEEIWLRKNETRISLKRKKIEEIGTIAFYENKNIQEVILPDTLRIIENNAFNLCENLEKITFPEGLERIDDNAFCNCLDLVSITVPNSIKYVGYGLFNDKGIIKFNEYEDCLYIGNNQNPYLILVDVSDYSKITYTIHKSRLE